MNCTCYDAGIEEAATTIEAYAEAKIPSYWAALREVARHVRARKRSTSAKPQGDT